MTSVFRTPLAGALRRHGLALMLLLAAVLAWQPAHAQLRVDISGIAGFDRAVETGIRRCNPFPKPSTGRYEPIIDVVYRMYD